MVGQQWRTAMLGGMLGARRGLKVRKGRGEGRGCLGWGMDCL